MVEYVFYIMTDTPLEKSTNSDYGASQIQVLEGLEAVRKRPGMYVGGTDSKAMHHLIYEVMDNSVDEALAGFCNRIEVTIHADESVTVRDNGRGIPTDIHPTFRTKAGDKISTLEVVMTNLHAGGKFGSGAYTVSGGLHGVGVKAVNALSSKLTAQVRRDGKIYQQTYKEGKPTSKVEVIGKMKDGETGTQISFLRDTTIFTEDNIFRWEALLQRFREMAFITRGLTIAFKDERHDNEMTFYFEDGISAFVRYLNRNKDTVHQVVYAEKKVDRIGVEFALQYTDATTSSEFYFANTIHTPDGGTHQAGFRSAITRTLNDYARKNNILKEKDPNLDSTDTLEGLTAIVSIKHPEPQFESQTKVKLMNTDARTATDQVVREAFTQFLEENNREAKQIIDKCLLSRRAREAAKAASELVRRKSALESGTLPGKLADCSERDPLKCELFIVEGDSAGGCFDGDTLVALADGRNLSFRNLVVEQAEGKVHFCYTIRNDGQIGLERAIHARVTKQDAEVVKITLDNGEEIICTPDHHFMLRDGNYKRADQLATEDSLMPLYRRLSSEHDDAYMMVWDPSLEQWVFVNSFVTDRRTPSIPQREQDLREAVAHYNHKITKVERLTDRRDVYDLEVPSTHNFALASGVFVHNSAKQGRDRHFQAILPLRGKIMNTERARLDKILQSEEVKALISALGTGIGDSFNLENRRYDRCVIMTDADVDGSHIRTLLLTFFFRYMQPLVEGGHLYIAQPPLFRLEAKRQKDVRYVFTIEERDAVLEEFKKRGLDITNHSQVMVQRYKGLGEMNPDQLWDTTMDPGTRTMLKVTINDGAEADRTFDMLMGDAVPPRRKFITTHAKEVQNLDV